jgi:hypothetical protein
MPFKEHCQASYFPIHCFPGNHGSLEAERGWSFLTDNG